MAAIDVTAEATIARPRSDVIAFASDPANDTQWIAGTLARIRIQGEATGFFRLAAPLLAAQVRRSITRDVNNLRRVLESQGQAP